jgi:hypothetical protein
MNSFGSVKELNGMRRTVLLAAAVAASVAGPALAGNTGHDLTQRCTDAIDVAQAYCAGFVSGVFSTSGLFCVTGHPSTGQLVEIFMEWADRHPEDLQRLYAATAVVASIMEAYPCPPSTPQPHVTRIPPSKGPDEMVR